MPTLKHKKYGQMGGKSLKIGTFLNFLYITYYWQIFTKIGTHGKNLLIFPPFFGSK